MTQDQFQTVKEVAERLKVCEATVRSWIREGTLRAIDIGKGWRIAERDLDRFLRSLETRPRDNSDKAMPAQQNGDADNA